MDHNILKRTCFLIFKRRASALFSLMEISLTWYWQLRFASIFTPKYLTLSVGYNLLPHNFLIFLSYLIFYHIIFLSSYLLIFRCSYLKKVALDFALLVLKLNPMQVGISIPLWIKHTMVQLLLLFLCNFCSFFNYVPFFTVIA